MAIISKITNIFSDIRNKIKPQHFEVTEAHYLSRRQMFAGFDEFNPTKMDSDDDIVDIGIDLAQNEEENNAEIELNQHKVQTQKILNFLA